MTDIVDPESKAPRLSALAAFWEKQAEECEDASARGGGEYLRGQGYAFEACAAALRTSEEYTNYDPLWRKGYETKLRTVDALLDRLFDVVGRHDVLRSQLARFLTGDEALGAAVREWVCSGCGHGCLPPSEFGVVTCAKCAFELKNLAASHIKSAATTQWMVARPATKAPDKFVLTPPHVVDGVSTYYASLEDALRWGYRLENVPEDPS